MSNIHVLILAITYKPHVFNKLWSSTLCSRGGAGKFHMFIKVCKTSILKIPIYINETLGKYYVHTYENLELWVYTLLVGTLEL